MKFLPIGSIRVLGLDSGYTVKYNPCLQEFPGASPSGTPSGKGLYLTVYPSSRPNTDAITKSLNVTGPVPTFISS